ncbi:MAG: peptide-methionine (S)-S-oxide reductase [Flavobacteriales bacterium]
MPRIGFGGGCHWCTEGVFDTIIGVTHVQQGWIASDAPNDTLSEAVIVWFDEDVVSMKDLISIHLLTHSSKSLHHMRQKYRSAIYTFSTTQQAAASNCLQAEQRSADKTIITAVLPFRAFQLNVPKYLHYYQSDPTKPFCTTNIDPKIRTVMAAMSRSVDPSRTEHLRNSGKQE